MDSGNPTATSQSNGSERGQRHLARSALSALVAVSFTLLVLGCGAGGTDEESGSSDESTSSSTTSLPTPLEVEVNEEVPFTSERTMDVYAPTESADWPLVVHFHGGRSSPGESEQFARSVAEQGAVVMVPQWRSLGPDGGSQDTVCALAFADEKGGEYGADTEQVTLSGYSTGGYTAVIHALVADTPPLPVTDCVVDPAIDPPAAVVGGGAPLFAAEWARQGMLAQNPQWAALTPEQVDAFDPYMAIGRNPDVQVHLVFAEDDVGGNPNLRQPIAESNRAYLEALVNGGYDAQATEVPGGHGDPLIPGSDAYETYVSVVASAARHE